MYTPRNNLTKVYILALALIAALTIATQVLIRNMLDNQMSDSRVVNIAGRQRMLSQKVAKLCFMVHHNKEKTSYQDELKATCRLLQQSHDALLNGNMAMGIPPKNHSGTVHTQLQEIKPHLDKIITICAQFVKPETDIVEQSQLLKQLTEHESEFLYLMNNIVFQYDSDASVRVENLKRIELILMTITLILLFSEGMLIFRPAIKKINTTMQTLAQNNLELAHDKDVIEAQNHEIATQNEELKQQSQKLLELNDSFMNIQSKLNELVAERQHNADQIAKQQSTLDETIVELKDTKSQLIQAEKLSSLGYLLAGVAHEINNPVNYIFSSVNVLDLMMQDLKQLHRLYDDFSADMDSEILEIKLNEIKQFKDSIFYGNIFNDFQKLVDSISDGTKRTKGIIASLRTFSRVSSTSMEKANLHENIESTLLIAEAQFKHQITVIKNFDPSLPLVECNIAELNQVFLNMLTNATHAIEEEGTITISTEYIRQNQSVTITFSDTGTGIEDGEISKLFEPFYTTKPIDEGTGLGLSISKGIIDDHKGHIKVESQKGRGSKFTIHLPISHHS